MSEVVTHQVSYHGLREIGFVKAHACGNDFLVIREENAAQEHSELASRLCSRTTGIGADGIEFLDRREDGSLFLRLFNADGSEAELSGNGTRCVAAWLAFCEGRMSTEFDTHGGVRRCRVLEQRAAMFRIESAMGVPRVMPRTLAMPGIGEVVGAMVSVGNPHFVVFTDAAEFSMYGMTWQELGGRISTDALFPHGTNVEFVRVLSREEIAIRIVERGCGPTLSSGTGTCAAVAAAISLRGIGRDVRALAEGGAQEVRWAGPANEMMLTGQADIVCEGRALVPDSTQMKPESLAFPEVV